MSLFDNTPDASTPRAPAPKKRDPAAPRGHAHGRTIQERYARKVCPDPGCKLKSHPDLLAERHEVTERYEDKVRRGKWRGRAFTIKVEP